MAGIRRSLPYQDWPPEDQVAWERAFAEGDIFDDWGTGAHLAPRSRVTIQRGYARWLGFLSNSEPTALREPLADRVNRARVRAYIDAVSARCSPVTVWNDAKSLYDAIRLMAPTYDWTWLKAVKARLEQRMPASRSAPVIDSGHLLDLGISLMDGAVQAADDARLSNILRYRDGLIIALLAARPLRRRTLARLRIGRQLQRIGETWVLVLEPEDLKNKEHAEFPLSNFLVPYLEVYLREIRPKIQGAADHDGLWASPKGGAMTHGTIYAAVRRRTKEAFGLPLNLHAFRHSAATTIAMHDPDHVGVSRDLLTHRDLRTTQRYYDMSRSLTAGRVQANQIAKLRRKLRSTAHHSRR